MGLAEEGLILFNSGRFKDALAKFLLARGEEGARPDLELFIGHCLRSLGRSAEALSLFRSLGRGKRRDLVSASLLAQAAVLKQEGKIEEASELLEGALKGNGREKRLRRDLAQLLRERLLRARALEQTDQSISILERMLSLDPSDGDARLELDFFLRKKAQGFLEAEDLEKTRVLLQRLLRLTPHQLDLTLELAALLVKKGKARESVHLLARALRDARRARRPAVAARKKLEAELARASWTLYGQLDAAGKSREAESLLRRLLRLGSERERTRIEMVSSLSRRGRLSEAIRLLRAARRQSPGIQRSLHELAISLAKGLGESLRREGALAPGRKGSRALSHLLKAMQELLGSKLLDAASLRAFRAEASASLLSLARKFAASEEPAKAFELKPVLLRGSLEESQRALQLFSDEHLRGGRVTAAQSLWKSAWRRSPRSSPRSDSPLRFSLLTALGRYAAAFALAEGRLDKGPTLAEARAFAYPWWSTRQFGYCQARHRDLLAGLAAADRFPPWPSFYAGLLSTPKPGLGDFEKLKDYPQERYGWMHLRAGWARLLSADFGKAVEHLEKAKRSRPMDWRAAAFQAEAHICLGDRETAMTSLQEAEVMAAAEKPDAVAWRGLLLLWLGEYQAALEATEEACRGKAQWATGWRGASKLKLGRIPEALADLDEALSYCPEDREALLWRGEAKRLLGRYGPALEDLGREPIGVWGRINRALAWDALGKERAMRREAALLDEDIRAYAASRCGLTLGSDPTREHLRLMLEAALSAARGYRKERGYGDSVWMR